MKFKFKSWVLSSLVAFGLLSSVPASATILFAGGEDLDFVLTGAVATSTSATFHRSAWARLAQNSGTTSNTTWPATIFFSTPGLGNQGTIWVHGETYESSSTQTILNNLMLMVLDGSGNTAFAIRGTGTNGQVKLSKVTTAGVYTDLVTCTGTTWPQVALTSFDLFLNYAVSGEATLYVNGASPCDFTGDVTTNSRTTVAQVAFNNIGSTNLLYWSEMIVATTDTRAMNLLTIPPLASGNATNWIPSTGSTPCTSTILSPTSYNDANFIYTASASVLEQCTVTATIPSGSWTVPAFITSARALVGVSGPQHIDFNVRISSTDYLSSDLAPGTTFGNIMNVWTTNPNTSGSWATTDFTAGGFNIGMESKN